MSKKRENKAESGSITIKHDLKKAAVLGTGEKKRRPPWLQMFAFVAVGGLLTLGVLFVMTKQGDKIPPAATISPSQPTAGALTHPVALFEDGKARFFSYAAGNDVTIKYFVLKSSDGIVRAAFDACDVCWPAGKGYSQEGDHMVCNNCGLRFASVLVNEVEGGCNPAPLTRQIENGNVVVHVPDVLEGKRYFESSPA